MRKADMVREMIKVAKAEGKTQQDLLQAVVDACKFGRGLARAYIANNWDKVEGGVQPIQFFKPSTTLLLTYSAPAASKPAKALSMTPSAIRKRAARAAAKQAVAA